MKPIRVRSPREMVAIGWALIHGKTWEEVSPMVELKSCPFCGASLRTVYGIVEGVAAPAYWEHPFTPARPEKCPIRGLYVPFNRVEWWNRRAPTEGDSRDG